MLKRALQFSVGQRIRKRTRGGGTWEIMAIREDMSGALHIEMFNINDHNTRRTLSDIALSDSDQFEVLS